jgi:hypothetical protein
LFSEKQKRRRQREDNMKKYMKHVHLYYSGNVVYRVCNRGMQND